MAASTLVTPVVLGLPEVTLHGDLHIPDNACGLVLFVHGSGSGRHSPRNQYVAQVLNDHGIATLLFDMLTLQEEVFDSNTFELRFDIEFLAKRVIGATNWVSNDSKTSALPIAYFGASTGAAAALTASTLVQRPVSAIVSRGGRPDLAVNSLALVTAPTLLIVGSHDSLVLELNKKAAARMACEKVIEVIKGAGHLFEEPGALKLVSSVAAKWFVQHFSRSLDLPPAHPFG